MDLKQLRFLVALDETRHFGQAALRCHVTQPTLSMRLRSLEEELELSLVNRGQRFEGFTEAGERVLAWARTILAAYEGLQAEAIACKGSLIGTLRLGIVPLASFDPLPLLKHWQSRFPQLRFELSALSSESILDQLANNNLDLGISYLDRLDAQHFECLDLAETRMGLLYDTRHFQLDDSSLTWESLVELPLGLLTRGMHFRQSIDHGFRSRGLKPEPILESDAVHLLLQAIGSGLCCSIMPLSSGLDQLVEHARLVPIEDAHTLAPLGLIMRRSEPRPALAEACFAEAGSFQKEPLVIP